MSLQTPKPPVFPKCSGSNLNEKKYALPADFETPHTIAIIAYQRWHQSHVDAWLPVVNEAIKDKKDWKFYEIPTLQSFSDGFKKFIDNGMRRGIPDLAVRAVTITLYLDQEAFNKSLQISGTKDIVLVITDRAGNVSFKAVGKPTEKSISDLKAAVAKVTG